MVSFMKKVLLALALALPIADAFQSLSGRALASPRRSLSRPYRSAGVRVVSATVMAAAVRVRRHTGIRSLQNLTIVTRNSHRQ